MQAPRRSAFGELCRFYRRKLGLTQPELRERVINLATNLPPGVSEEDIGSSYIAVNTISNWEKKRAPGDDFPKPYKSTVKAVALALGLMPGTSEYQHFLAMSRLPDQFGHEDHASHPPIALPVIESRPAREGFVTAGRETQIRQIRNIINQAVAGKPGVAIISGVAGTGKTRLMEELCAEAVERHANLMIAWGECTGDNVAISDLQPFRQMVSVLTGGLREANPLQLVSTRNLTRLAENVPSVIKTLLSTSPNLVDALISTQTLNERARAFSLNDETIDAISRAEHARSASRHVHTGGNALFDFLAACSVDFPLVLVIDNLHWADEVSSTMFFHLVQRLRGSSARIAIIGSHRIAELEGMPEDARHPMRRILNETLLLFPEAHIDLSLAIGGDAGRHYIDGVLARRTNNLDESFRQRLFRQTSGFPLLVKAVLDNFERDGYLVPDANGRIGLALEPDWQTIPVEIESIYRERIERMPLDLREMLFYAAIQGDVFIAEVIMVTMDLTPDTLKDVLESQLLRIHRLVRAEGATTINRNLAHLYRLEHALLREVLLKLLPPFETSSKHEQVANALNQLYGDGPHEYSAITARHFEIAGNRVAAARARIAAGAFAMDHFELDTALNHFQHVDHLHILEQAPAVYIQSLTKAADCQRSRDFLREAKSLAERAIALSVRHGARNEEAESCASLGMIEFDLGHHREAVALLQKSLDIQQQLAGSRDTFRVHALLSHALYALDRYEEAIAAAQAAEQLGAELGDDRLQGEALIARTNCHVDLGDFTGALANYQRAREFCIRAGHMRGAAVCLLNIALCHLELGNLDSAEQVIADVTSLERRISMPQISSASRYYAGLIAEARGDCPRAAANFSESFHSRHQRGQTRAILDPLAGLLRIAVLLGDRQQVVPLLHELTQAVELDSVDGVEHAARLYLTLVSANRFLGNQEVADRWQRTGQAYLQDHAARISDPTLRASYLENVPAHRSLAAPDHPSK